MGVSVIALDATGSGLADIAAYLAFINTAIACFNLLPAFPMDGGRLLRGFLWSRGGSVLSATRGAAAAGEVFAVLFMVAGIGLLVFVDFFSGLWLLLIGNFMRDSSSSSYEQVLVDKMVSGVPAATLSHAAFATVAPDATLEELVERHFFAGPAKCLPVTTHGTELLGLVTLADVRKVQRDAWATTTAFRAMTPFARLQTVTAKDDLAAVLTIMASYNVNQVPVVEGTRLLGMIERSDVISFIQSRSVLADVNGEPPARLAAVGG
jgi:CBS domain-containing protein